LAILVILILAILWGAVLLPPILRSRNESGGASGGIGDFVGKLRSGLGSRHGGDPALAPLTPIMGPVGPVGGPMGPGAPMGPVRVPGAMSPTQRRRRDVLVGLLAAVGFTLLMAVFSGTMVFWALQLLADTLLGGYLYLLLQYKARSAEQAPQQARPAEPARPTNVAHIAGRRPRVQPGDVTMPSHVDAPREATVLALRRTASW
jgi:hypothetical protein